MGSMAAIASGQTGRPVAWSQSAAQGLEKCKRRCCEHRACAKSDGPESDGTQPFVVRPTVGAANGHTDAYDRNRPYDLQSDLSHSDHRLLTYCSTHRAQPDGVRFAIAHCVTGPQCTGNGHRVERKPMARNVSNIPTGRTYLGFALVWTIVAFLVFLLCIAVFAAGRWIAGLFIVLLTVYLYVRHSISIGKRARRGLVRRR